MYIGGLFVCNLDDSNCTTTVVQPEFDYIRIYVHCSHLTMRWSIIASQQGGMLAMEAQGSTYFKS